MGSAAELVAPPSLIAANQILVNASELVVCSKHTRMEN
jgi:hypothetical protein